MPAILEFIDSGRNVLLAVSSEVSDTLRTLAAEVGVDLDEKGTNVFDHMGAQQGDDHSLIASSEVAKLSNILGDKDIKVIFEGGGITDAHVRWTWFCTLYTVHTHTSYTCTHTHTHTHTHKHTHTNTNTNGHTRTCVRTHAYTHAHTQTRTYTHAHAYARTHKHTHTHTNIYTHIHKHTHNAFVCECCTVLHE